MGKEIIRGRFFESGEPSEAKFMSPIEELEEIKKRGIKNEKDEARIEELEKKIKSEQDESKPKRKSGVVFKS